jgi:hypothetical protein
MDRLREAECPQTAFVEARGDLCPWRVFLCENVATDPTEPRLRVAMKDDWRSVPRLQPKNRHLRCGDRSQKIIQYP